MEFINIDFDISRVEDRNVRLVASNDWTVDRDMLEVHTTADGQQIFAALIDGNGSTHLGLWTDGGTPLYGPLPYLHMQVEHVPQDIRRGFVNIYRSTENAHGFTVGSATYASADDAIARGKRNSSGNYIRTVELTIDINGRNNEPHNG